MSIKMNKSRTRFVQAAQAAGFLPGSVITRGQVLTILASNPGLKHPSWLTSGNFTVGRGVYRLPDVKLDGTGASASAPASAPAPASVQLLPEPERHASTMTAEAKPAAILNALHMTSGASEALVPTESSLFVPFGFYADLKRVFESKRFFPMYITGLSGNGKTTGIEQACAELHRELFRVNITEETDEDDLLGGFRLRDGATVFEPGPVVRAMERGAVLLLDEIDLASTKIMCLQPVLEGKGVFLKKAGRWVTPAAGFNIVATANTKGKGSDDGRFVGTGALNEAFLDRFPLTYEQDYPTVAVERKILNKIAASTSNPPLSKPAIAALLDWAQLNRKQYAEQGISEVISTRRLVNIVIAFGIFGDIKKAVQQCISRFDDDTRRALSDAFDKIYVETSAQPEIDEQAAAIKLDPDKCPF